MKPLSLLMVGLTLLATQASVSFAQGGTISGVVVEARSGAPAGDAVVKLTDEPPSVAPPGFQSQSTRTDAAGAFRFENVEPGTYYVVANVDGHLPAEYGQRSPTGTGIPFDVQNGQRVSVRLVAWLTSGISGRVVDADGDPVGRTQVVALRSIYSDGKPTTTLAQSVTTNDRGEYRMFWLTPGTYRVAAREWDSNLLTPGVNIGPPRRFAESTQATGPIVHGRTLPDGTVVEETDVPIYAPSTPDPQIASTIVLAPGDSATNVDIQLVGNRVRAYHVRGVVSTEGNRPAVLLMVPRSPSAIARVPSAVAKPDGSFDIAGVVSGSYILFMQFGALAQRVDVTDADVTVNLSSSSPISLSGHVTFDRGMSVSTANPNASDLQIKMTRDPELLGAPEGGAAFNRPPRPNGIIDLSQIPPGDYRVDLWPFANRRESTLMSGRPMPEGFANAYVKSIHFGNTDVLADGLHLWGPTQSQLEIVIGLNGAQVDGTVVDNAHERAANVTVIAVPDGSNRGRADLSRRTNSDARGRFAIEGLAPGDYTFYAWDDVERGAWQSPEFIRAFDGRGRFVRLREGKNEPLELTVLVGR